MLTATELKTILRAQGIRLTKRLGQHHLIDSRAITRVIAACELSTQDTVVEIGPGLGALTEPLAQEAGQVIAVEVDRHIAALLTERMASRQNVTVISADILTFDWTHVGPVVVVGAIPYSITSPILSVLSEWQHTIQRAVLIVQQEVARRLLALPGTKSYGRLSILAQYHWDVSFVSTIGRHAFFPQPDVDSSCLRLAPHRHTLLPQEDTARFFAFVKAAFAHRRKSLLNSLRDAELDGFVRADVEAVLCQLGYPLSLRGETLSLEQFIAVFRALDLPRSSLER